MGCKGLDYHPYFSYLQSIRGEKLSNALLIYFFLTEHCKLCKVPNCGYKVTWLVRFVDL